MVQLDDIFFRQPMWNEKRFYSKAEVWICFLKEANRPLINIIDGNVKLEVGNGTFYTSYKALSYSFGWSVAQIIKYINALEKHGLINVKKVEKTKSIIIDVKEISQKNEGTITKFEKTPRITTYAKKKQENRCEKGEPIFDFGKYNGLRISKCKDLQYLKWVYRNVDLDDFMQFAVEKQIDKLEAYKYI